MIFPLIPTTYYYNAVLANIIDSTLAAPTLLAAAKQGLSNAIFTPGVGTVFADTPAPGFTGYAQSATVVWGAPLNEGNGGQNSLSPAAPFRATAVPSPETIYGGFVSDGVASPSTGILGSWKLTPAYPIQNAGDGFSVVIGWCLGPNLTTAYADVST